MHNYKVCFWLNVPSNHQSLFLDALKQNDNIDLQVRYFAKPSEDRLKLGWRGEKDLSPYEQYINSVDDGLKTIKNWKERIHIVMGYGYKFNKELIPILIENNVKWVHWSERYGVSLAQRLSYNLTLFKLLRPLFLLTKKPYGKLVNNYAYGCFAQGELARRDFVAIGINNLKIENLFYTTAPTLSSIKKPTQLKTFPYKYNFLYVGRLNKRKGIAELLKAFSFLSSAQDWGLVLVGDDESNGKYHALVKKLGLEKKILFVGSVKANKVTNFFKHTDVFILPSHFDGWGAVLNEALSAGMPLISTKQTGAAFHTIENNKNGYIVEASDTIALKNKMQSYVSDKNLLKEHSTYSYKLAEAFTPEKNVARFINALTTWKKSRI